MTPHDAPTMFDAQAATYEGERRLLIPPFDEFYGTAVDALALARRPLRRVLDLGAGTGLLSRRVRAAHPGARLTLVDGAPRMLAEARDALGDAAAYVTADLADPLPAGEWDAVVSALAIHHLGDAAKRDLFARVHEALVPGGVFVNAEQVAGPTALFDDHYAEWHARRARELGAAEDVWAASAERKRLDRCATVEVQLGWLRAAGFADADCLFKDRCFAVLVALRAG
jgi:tRNA (cmo5U34)-methyltransferase